MLKSPEELCEDATFTTEVISKERKLQACPKNRTCSVEQRGREMRHHKLWSGGLLANGAGHGNDTC